MFKTHNTQPLNNYTFFFAACEILFNVSKTKLNPKLEQWLYFPFKKTCGLFV